VIKNTANIAVPTFTEKLATKAPTAPATGEVKVETPAAPATGEVQPK